VTDTAIAGADVTAAGADFAVATRDRVALGLPLVGVLLAAVVRVMARARPEARHADDATESGQSEIVFGIIRISRLADDSELAALLRRVAQRVAHRYCPQNQRQAARRFFVAKATIL
jgi:hypothetical protein